MVGKVGLLYTVFSFDVMIIEVLRREILQHSRAAAAKFCLEPQNVCDVDRCKQI